MFCNFKDNSVKKKVAKEFLLPQYLYLENWIKCIAVLRNACAHHARIWNRRFPTMPIMPKYLPSQWVITGNFRPNKLYPQLCCLAYLEQSIAANGSFSKRLLKLIDKSESVNTRSMGFHKSGKTNHCGLLRHIANEIFIRFADLQSAASKNAVAELGLANPSSFFGKDGIFTFSPF